MKPVIYTRRPTLASNIKFIDAYPPAIAELFFIDNPKIKKGTPEANRLLKQFLAKNKIKDVWIYYPERKIVVRSVGEHLYFKLRTSRNKNLITELEQKNFRNLTVGIAGLSVGSNILSALVVSGGPKKIKIADFDNLEITNLNRIRGGLLDIGQDKTEIAARQVWELDPFADITQFNKGIDEANLKKFLLGNPKLNVFIDEMDSLPLKAHARLICRQYKIPVLMATDNGDSVVLDVERFDLEPKRQIFHGLIGKVGPKDFENLNYKQWLSLATKIVGAEYLTEAMQDSLLQIGKTLPAVPQLGAVASTAGAAMSLVLRRIANKQPMPSGRYLISLEEKLVPGFSSKTNIKRRKTKTEKFKKLF